jgi:amino acid adenylation domain-containing protein
VTELTVREREALAQRLAAAPAGPPGGAITRRPPGPAPLSFAQTRLWFFDRLMPGSPLYNICFTAPIRFALDLRVLREALGTIVERHEVLRTVFRQEGEEAVQVVLGAVEVPIQAADLRRLPAERRQAELLRQAAAFQDRPFDLTRGPVLRALVAWLAPREYLLVIAVHHVAADGWSLGVLSRELEIAYAALARGRRPALPALPVQYADFAAWQRERLSGERLAAEVEHWRARLRELPVLDLPTDHPRPPVQLHRGADLAFTVPAALVDRLTRLGRERRATPFMVLLAAFDVLLSRWAGQDDVVVGAPIAGRSRPEIEGLIGFFVNTLVLRVDLSGDPAFSSVLERVRAAALDAYAHQDLPFEKLVEELSPDRDLSRNPLVQVIFQLFEAGANPSAGALRAGTSLPSRTSLFDLRVDLAPGPGGLAGRVEYDVDLFEPATIERFVAQYERLLEQVADDPDRPLSAYELLGEEERRTLERFGSAPAPAATRWAHELVADRAAAAPESPAVLAGELTLTFGELDARARELAAALAARGAGPGAVVGVCVPRGPDLVVTVLGILRAGAAYLPLEPDVPAARRAFMAADSGAALAVAAGEGRSWVPDGLDVLELSTRGAADAALLARPSAVDPAWVLYTSGSSGRPKGVPGTHGGLANRLAWGERAQPFTPGDIAIAKTRLGFVDAVAELLAPLAAGVPVVLADEATAGDPARLARLVHDRGVTRLVLVPSLLRVLLEVAPELLRTSRLRLVTLSGESLGAADARALQQLLPACELWNVYGSTEVAADATAHRLTRHEPDRVPIGRPLDNVTVTLTGPDGRPVPLGAVGDITVGGAGVAPGYLGHAASENERFTAGGYRTGDLGRWRPDGTLEHRGRADRQVKLRGIRVEPDEVEHALEAHPAVTGAAVLVTAEENLVAFYSAAPPTPPEEVRRHLQALLPRHLIPAPLTELPTLPRLPNGKLDRRALADVAPTATDDAPPRSSEEVAVAEVFAELTGAERVGREDDFFALGGHSLLATRAVSRLAERLGKPIELRLLFEQRTVASFAAAIAALDASAAPLGSRIERVDRERFRAG